MKKNISLLVVKIIISIYFFTSSYNLNAQEYNTIYWMQGIPQSAFSNPAHQLDAGIYIGTPGASSIYAGFGNSGFKFSDMLRKDNSGQMYWDEDNMLSKLSTKNLMYSDVQVEILTFGFRLHDDNYIHFNYSQKMGMQAGYPKDLFLLGLKGNNYFLENTENGEANFDALRLNLMQYSEYGIGYSRKLNEQFDVGARVKFLFGHANARLTANDFRFVTNPETFAINLHADVTLNTSLPVEIGAIEIDSEDDNGSDPLEGFDDYEFDPVEYLLNFRNFGLAGDLGVIYNFDYNLTFALSIVDLGYIKWKNNAGNHNLTGEVFFDGIDVENLFEYGGLGEHVDDEENGNDEDSDLFDEMLDNVEVNHSSNPYSFMLSPKIYLSAKYDIADWHSVSFLTRGIIVDSKIHPSFTLAYNIQPIKPIGFTLSYSVIHGNFTNIGFGMHLNLYPFQLYIIADNTFPGIQPHTTQLANVHLGINWVIGYRDKGDPAKPIHRWGF